MPDPTLYLFDGHNLLHAGGFSDERELVDTLASWVALKGARGVVVFDGAGQDVERGPLAVRHAPHADSLLERLAAENRGRELVCLVSSDLTIHGTTGQEVRSMGSQVFLQGLPLDEAVPDRAPPAHLADRLDPETRARLERLRRGQD